MKLNKDIYSKLLEDLPQPTSLLDKNYTYVYVNKSYETFYGVTNGEIVGKKVTDFLGKENFESVIKHYFDRCLQGENTQFINTFENSEGHIVSAIVKYSPFRNDSGEVKGVIASCIDTEELDFLDKEMFERKRMYRLFLDSRDDLIFFKDKDLTYRISNRANTEFLGGHNEQDIIGKTDRELMPRDTAEHCAASDLEAIETGKRVVSKERIGARTYKTIKIPVLENGCCVGVAGIIQDITAQANMENELKQSEEKYRSLVENALEGIFIVQDEEVVFCNPVLEMISGYSLEEMKHMSFTDMIFRDDRQLIALNNMKRLAGENIPPYDFRVLRKSGMPLWVRLNATSIQWQDKPAVLCFISDIQERKQSEVALRESEEKFRRLSESSPTAIMMYQNNRWVYANDKAAKMTGHTLQQLYSMNFWEIVHPEDRKRVIENGLRRQSSFQAEGSYSFRIKTRSGDVRWVQLSGASTFFKGEPAGIISVTDITQQKEDQKKLQDSEANFRFLSDVTFESIVIHKDGIIIDVNRSFEDLTGYSREEAIGQNLMTAPAFSKDMKIAMNKIRIPNTKPYQIRVRKKNGEIFWCEIEGRDSVRNDETIRIVAIRDITERILMENKLRESEERFRMIFENAPIMIDSFDEQGRSVLWNKECEKNLGWKRSEIENSDMLLKNCYPDPGLLKQALEDIKRSDGVFREYVIMTKSGQQRYHSWANFKLPNGTPISVGYDLTERLQAEKALKDLNEEKDKFFSIIAHDLKSPFNAILGFSELLLEKVAHQGCEDLTAFAEQMNKASKQGFDLLTNLLEWSRNQSGRMVFAPKRLDLEKSIANIMEQLQPQADEKHVNLEKATEKTLVKADPHMLETILRNLVSNAIKYSRKDQAVKISLEKNETDIRIVVRDEGIGMSKKDQQKLFKLDAGFTTEGTNHETGTGLGLILSRDLAKRHGGKILVESQSGKGSAFTLVLPV